MAIQLPAAPRPAGPTALGLRRRLWLALARLGTRTHRAGPRLTDLSDHTLRDIGLTPDPSARRRSRPLGL